MVVATPNPWAHPDIRRARDQFRRVLAAWTHDALNLRRQGLDRPGARRSGARRKAA